MKKTARLEAKNVKKLLHLERTVVRELTSVEMHQVIGGANDSGNNKTCSVTQ